MAGGGGGGDGEPEFQIAPMIDVLLVLLVFFVMITSAEVLKVDKNIKLPVSPNAKVWIAVRGSLIERSRRLTPFLNSPSVRK